MRYFVTGVNGQLGRAVVKELIKRGHQVTGCGRSEKYCDGECDYVCDVSYIQLDITDEDAVKRQIALADPYAVIHCAAWTAVDKAEDEENRDTVYAVNALGTGYIAQACKDAGCKMLYVSSDYVFGGEGTSPLSAQSTDFNPLNHYGKTKLEGEKAVASTLEKFFIVRTSWVFGLGGGNFVKSIINAGKSHGEVRVVNDQIGRPAYCADLAVLFADMCETDKYGYYHATNEGDFISWYDFTKEIYRQYGLDTVVIPVSTAEYGNAKAQRPFNSRLDTGKLIQNGFNRLPVWKDALSRYLKEAGF